MMAIVTMREHTEARMREAARREGPMSEVWQFRRYRIVEGRLDEFVDAWRNGVLPLRKQFGFTVRGAWVSPDQDTFFWILGYDGPGTFEKRDAAYYGSPERAALSPDPADLIEEAETFFMTSLTDED
jgi:hypothetical protein